MAEPAPAVVPPRAHRVLGIVLPVLGVLVLVGLMVFAGRGVWQYFRNPAALRALVASWGVWAPVGIILFQAIQVIIAPLPGNLMSFACGYALGVWPSIVWLMVGILVGATIDFLVARLVGRSILRYFVPPDKLQRLDTTILKRGAFYIFLLLLVPNPLGDWVYYLAGMTRLPLPVFLLFVFIARLPSNLIESSLGAGATRFGWREWTILGLVVAILSLLYYVNQKRIDRLLERWSERRKPENR
jgi:uncharacterized membrane protein YdjX (TVP38/TMEM64 family)